MVLDKLAVAQVAHCSPKSNFSLDLCVGYHGLNTRMLEHLLWNWISGFFTEWLIYGMVAVGLALTLASKIAAVIPGIGAYARLLTPIGFLVFTAGVYMSGGLGVQQMWQARVDEVKAQLAEAEAKSAEANQRLAQDLATKTTAIREQQQEIANEIDENREQINSECKLSADAVRLHNRSAGGL